MNQQESITPIDPGYVRYWRIFWFLFKSILLLVVFLASVCISPWLAAKKREAVEQTIAELNTPIDNSGKPVPRLGWARDGASAPRKTILRKDQVQFPFRADEFGKYSSAGLYAIDRVQSYFESPEFSVIQSIQLDGRNNFEQSLAALQTLQYVDFADIRYVDTQELSIQPLGNLTTIEQLQFVSCTFDADAINTLQEMDDLRFLFFYECSFTEDGWQALTNVKQVHWLILHNSRKARGRVTLAEIESLRKTLNKTYISMYDNQLKTHGSFLNTQ